MDLINYRDNKLLKYFKEIQRNRRMFGEHKVKQTY